MPIQLVNTTCRIVQHGLKRLLSERKLRDRFSLSVQFPFFYNHGQNLLDHLYSVSLIYKDKYHFILHGHIMQNYPFHITERRLHYNSLSFFSHQLSLPSKVNPCSPSLPLFPPHPQDNVASTEMGSHKQIELVPLSKQLFKQLAANMGRGE